MLKVKTTFSTYVHTGVGGVLLKVGAFQPVLENMTPWRHYCGFGSYKEPDHYSDMPTVGERWVIWGFQRLCSGLREHPEYISTSTVVSITDYSTWARRIDQPRYNLCADHVFALAKHDDVRLCTSFYTEDDCSLCD
jgi:hypothetical protein